ncbi:MAG: two pore domain potassium channel family protein [Thiotrichales bacterium]|nr:two pore domain potassium channel family protein [Thiotrichales bacterium]
MQLRTRLGIAGVSSLENARARKVGRIFDYLVAFALFLVLLQFLLSYSLYPIHSSKFATFLWLVFVAELLLNVTLVKQRMLYLAQNWLSMLVIILAIPWIEWGTDWALGLALLRLMLLLRFISGFFTDLMTLFGRNRFGRILIGFALLVLVSAGIFALLEQRSFGEGLWYAVVTITTVGYGDVVPVTEAGRAFGIVLIVFGVLLFSLVTANLAAFLIESEQRKLQQNILRSVRETEKRLTKQSLEIEAHVEAIIQHSSREMEKLHEVLKRYEHLEHHLRSLEAQKNRSSLNEPKG